MTIKDAINTEVKDGQLVEKYCIFRGVDPLATYASGNFTEAEIIKAYCFKALVSQPDWSEDGLSVKYNRAELIKQANVIFENNDLTDEVILTEGSITNLTPLW